MQKKSREFDRLKREKGCSICGYNKFGCALDHHHVDPDSINSEKRKTGYVTVSNFRYPSGKKEMKKCQLVCSNCHRFLTWRNANLKIDPQH